MPRFEVQIDAGRKDRRLTSAAPAKRRVMPDPQLLFYRRMIDTAAADAKKTVKGLPTDLAILGRYWIEEYAPSQNDKSDWERSFACCCSWLNVDIEEERKRLLAEIDAALDDAYRSYARGFRYQRRAVVLTCAGIVTAVARQYVLPLVSVAEYDDIAGVERDDPPNAMTGLQQTVAA